jgi:protein MpaA
MKLIHSVLLLTLAGGCALQSKKILEDAATTKAPSHPQGAAPTIVGTSVQSRPIELYRFGNQPNPVLIFAAIHGDEPTTAVLAKNLIKLLSEDPKYTQRISIAIIPVANPDGLAAGTRVNAHHIDCNRNFPAANWTTSERKTQYYNGEKSASEPETQAIMKAVQELKPCRIMAIHSIDRRRQCNNYDGPAKDIAELMSQYNHYPATATIGYPTPGSFGSWAGIDQKIPTITLELPRTTPGEKAWEENRDALLAFIGGVESE